MRENTLERPAEPQVRYSDLFWLFLAGSVLGVIIEGVFYAMNCELRAARGKVFDHDPDFRRYMGVVEY